MDNKTFYYAYNAYLNSKGNAVVGTAADDDSVALIFKLYHYLATQPVQPIERTTENTIINEKNFLENIILEVTGQPKDHPANLDDITTNDVYNVDLNFELMVKPDTTGDELVLMIMDGETVVAKGRIAGALQDGEVQLAPDESGYKFRFPSLTLEEGMQNIRFVLTGEQHLGNAAYLFTSEVIEDVGSQTMVALAEGDREVKVSMDISFSLDIENEIITKEHIWRNEKTLKGSIEGLKTDEYNTVVQGAVFGLFDADAEVFTEENALMVSTSDENGKFSFSEVPFGKYLVKELSCPEMYILNEEPVEVNITRETQQMEISVENEFVRGKVQVNKISSKKHSKKLSGAEFDVYTDVNSNGLCDADTDTFYGELIAVKKGVYELDGLKFGDYLLVETKPPKGFVRDKNYYSFSISEDGATVKVENEAGVGFTNTPKPPEDPNDPPPDTGDSSNPWIWGAVMAVSGAGALMFITDKRRRNGER